MSIVGVATAIVSAADIPGQLHTWSRWIGSIDAESLLRWILVLAGTLAAVLANAADLSRKFPRALGWIKKTPARPFVGNYYARYDEGHGSLLIAFIVVPRSASRCVIQERAGGYVVIDEVSVVHNVRLKAAEQPDGVLSATVTATLSNSPDVAQRIQGKRGSGLLAEVDLRHLEVYYNEGGTRQRLQTADFLRLHESGYVQLVIKGTIDVTAGAASMSTS